MQVQSLFEGYDLFYWVGVKDAWYSVYVCSISAECVCVCVLLTAVAGRRGRQTPPWAGRWSYFHTAHWEITTHTCIRHGKWQQGEYLCRDTCRNWAQGHLQGVEGAQALEGIRSYLWDLVVAQVSALKKKVRDLVKETEVLGKVIFLWKVLPQCHLGVLIIHPLVSLASNGEINVVGAGLRWVPALSHICWWEIQGI